MTRPRGGIIAGTLPAWTTTSTSGVFTLREAQEMRAANTWARGPVAPTGLTATAGDAKIDLTWVAPTNTHGHSITSYMIEYTPSGGAPSYVLTGSTATAFSLTALTNDVSYNVRVAAVTFTAGDFSASLARTPSAIITLNIVQQSLSSNQSMWTVRFDSRSREAAVADWRVSATTNWGRTWTNRAPSVVTNTSNGEPNALAFFYADGFGAGHVYPQLLNRPGSTLDVTFNLIDVYVLGEGFAYNSNWTLQALVGGVLKYQVSFTLSGVAPA